MELLRRHVVEVAFHVKDHVESIARLLRKYANVPMSLADGCLVHMAKLSAESMILTLDGLFESVRPERSLLHCKGEAYPANGNCKQLFCGIPRLTITRTVVALSFVCPGRRRCPGSCPTGALIYRPGQTFFCDLLIACQSISKARGSRSRMRRWNVPLLRGCPV
jgi:hypothetical protein